MKIGVTLPFSKYVFHTFLAPDVFSGYENAVRRATHLILNKDNQDFLKGTAS